MFDSTMVYLGIGLLIVAVWSGFFALAYILCALTISSFPANGGAGIHKSYENIFTLIWLLSSIVSAIAAVVAFVYKAVRQAKFKFFYLIIPFIILLSGLLLVHGASNNVRNTRTIFEMVPR